MMAIRKQAYLEIYALFAILCEHATYNLFTLRSVEGKLNPVGNEFWVCSFYVANAAGFHHISSMKYALSIMYEKKIIFIINCKVESKRISTFLIYMGAPSYLCKWRNNACCFFLTTLQNYFPNLIPQTLIWTFIQISRSYEYFVK